MLLVSLTSIVAMVAIGVAAFIALSDFSAGRVAVVGVVAAIIAIPAVTLGAPTVSQWLAESHEAAQHDTGPLLGFVSPRAK